MAKMKKIAISTNILKRAALGEPQQVHIEWPQELGPYGPKCTDEMIDAWVTAHIQIPDGLEIASRGCGRAYKRKSLLPCITVTISSTQHRFFAPLRRVWADGIGGVR